MLDEFKYKFPDNYARFSAVSTSENVAEVRLPHACAVAYLGTCRALGPNLVA